MDDTSTTIPVERTGPAPLKRIGLLGAVAAAIVAVGILAAGFSASPAGTLAAGSGSGDLPERVIDLSLGAFRDADRVGPGFGRGPGFGGITITAISGSKLSLATADGWTRTITVDSGTTYTQSGDAIALSDLSVGDEIRFQQTREDDGTFSIDAIAVIPPHLGGKVTAISGSTITVERRDGTTGSVKVTASTTFTVGADEDAALADVEVGMLLMAEGTENSDGSLTATSVRAFDPASMPGPGGPGGPGGHGRYGRGGFGGGGPWSGDTTPDGASDSAS